VWALVTPLLAGCASFKASKRLDVGPFAENTVGMIGEVQRVTKPVVWVHLKKYEQSPAILEVRRAYAPARRLMRSVALYSTQIVSIYESPLPDDRKAALLAQYLDESVRERLKENASARMFLSPGTLDSSVTQVRQARDFLGALGAAQPVVSAALSYGNSVYDSIEVMIDAAGQDLNARIEEEFAPLKRQIADLTSLQLDATRVYTLLSRYRKGDEPALDSLRALDPAAAAALPEGKRPSEASLDAAEKKILAEIDTHMRLRQDLLAQFEVYGAEQRELDELRTRAMESARLGRITLILWARSHRNLAAGVTVPAAINVMGMVRSAASGASGIAL
jgi:hypothetical protein